MQVEVKQVDREAAIALLGNGFRNIELPPLSHEDLADIGRALASVIQAAERRGAEAMREMAAGVADQYSAERRAASADAKTRKQRQEARDFESMAIEGVHIATAIRALPCPTEPPGAASEEG